MTRRTRPRFLPLVVALAVTIASPALAIKGGSNSVDPGGMRSHVVQIKGPGGTHLFLSGEEAIKSMTIGKGLKVTLFASE